MECFKSFTIVFENEDFAILNKKQGIPTAPLKKGDTSALTEFCNTRTLTEQVLGKKEVEAGLLHRLDTATSGLILIAKRQKIYDTMQHMQELNLIEKEYIATCDVISTTRESAFLPLLPHRVGTLCQITSFFVPFGKGAQKVKAVFTSSLSPNLSNKKRKALSKKEYTTRVNLVSCKAEEVTCICRLTQGYRHQVRCHLATVGLPIKGDALYNIKYIEEHRAILAEQISSHSYPLALQACKISFPSPYLPLSHTTERLSFSLPLQDRTNP